MALAAFTPSPFRFSSLPTARVAVPTSPAEIALATADADLETAILRIYTGANSPLSAWTGGSLARMVARSNFAALRDFLMTALAAQHGCPHAARELTTRC